MQRFRLSVSFAFKVARTRSSILEASLYFCTLRMILMATGLSRRLSRAFTTFPKVPCPRRWRIWSELRSVQLPCCFIKGVVGWSRKKKKKKPPRKHTVRSELRLGNYDEMAIFIVIFHVLIAGKLRKGNHMLVNDNNITMRGWNGSSLIYSRLERRGP